MDGAGTSTQAVALQGYIQHHYGECLLEREPCPSTQKGLELQIRDHISRGTPQDEMAVLYTADRILHCLDVLEPALREGTHVVCDRYQMSTAVYQTVGRPDHEHAFIKRLTRLPAITVPDYTFVLDVLPSTALKRLGDPHKLDRYERDRDYQQQVRQGYLSAAKVVNNCAVIDGDADARAVTMKLREYLWHLRW